MKKFFLLVIFLSFLTENLYTQWRETVLTVPNPSFEEWEIDSLTWGSRGPRWEPKYWDIYYSDYDEADEVFSQSTDAVDGNYSLRLDGTSCCLNPRGEYTWTLAENAEMFFYISFYVKAEGFLEHWYSPEASIACDVYYFLENGQEVYGECFYRTIFPQGNWVQITAPLDMNQYVIGSVAGGQLKLQMDVCGSSNEDGGPILPGTIWIDNIQVSTTPFTTQLIKPKLGDTFIAGQEDTIKWEPGQAGQLVKLEYNNGNSANYSLLEDSLLYNEGSYLWDVPSNILKSNARLRLVNQSNNEVLAESYPFTIKPYIITKKDYRDLIAYDVTKDRWGFGNTPDEMWPEEWYKTFKYKTGIDPFTNSMYDQVALGGVFATADSSERPDWISFVGAFGENVCYSALGDYSLPALQKWSAIKGSWGGSCFGIAISNALAFENPNQFRSRYPFFPYFQEANSVQSDSNVIPVTMELFTHQSGNPHELYRNSIGINKTPSETIEDIKQMLKQESVEIRTLSFNNNGPGGGGHAINIYKLEQDTINANLYYVYVWDNSYPDVIDAKIVVDVSHNGGIGFWDPQYGWDGWEGETKFYLRDPASSYLTNAILPKGWITNSPFILAKNELKIYNSLDADIIIEDNFGNQTGFTNSELKEDIPNSIPLILDDGSTGPPYGYYLPTDNYSVVMNNFTADSIDAYFFTGNRSYSFERSGATNTETDRLFFDGGISVSNHDAGTKRVKLLNVISDTTSSDEKLFLIRSLSLAENDSVKISNPEDNTLELKSFGSEKSYQVELEFVSDVVSSRFLNDNITLTENTTHKLVPNWGDFAALDLQILVDEGNNGTIDDTLHLEDRGTAVEEHGSNTPPTKYGLEQNYPNPFNPSTTLKYSIPSVIANGVKQSHEITHVVLKVYDILGRVVAVLVNEQQKAGNYEVEFDASTLTSGIYFYRIQAGEFVETKKMVLMK